MYKFDSNTIKSSRHHLFIILRSLLILLLFSNLSMATEKQPDIVIFIADDLSIIDVGCYGNHIIRTPNIDKLAMEGMRFQRAFTTTAMCTPSRSAIYTGLYPHRNGAHMNHGDVFDGTKSMPHFLKKLGYRVALSGKKHIGPKESFPFEYIDFKEKKGNTGKLDFDAMEDFISESSEPFCLVIASADPHGPHESGKYKADQIEIPGNWLDTPETRQLLAGYYADIEIMDQEVARIDALLSKYKKKDNTLFIFLSDHGFDFFAKWTCYNIGLRVPFIVRWPEKIEANTQTKALVSFVDILPTLIEAAGVEKNEQFDGLSFLSVLTGNKENHHQQVFAAHTNRGIWSGSPYPIRSVITRKYHYILNLNYQEIATQVANDIIAIIDQIPLEELRKLEINKPQENTQGEAKKEGP